MIYLGWQSVMQQHRHLKLEIQELHEGTKKRSMLIGRSPGALTASSTEEIGRIIKILPFMKEVLWLRAQQSEVSQIKWCVRFIYNLPTTSRCYNPNFMNELEEDMRWTASDLQKLSLLQQVMEMLGSVICK
jgi:hypothetical protein